MSHDLIGEKTFPIIIAYDRYFILCWIKNKLLSHDLYYIVVVILENNMTGKFQNLVAIHQRMSNSGKHIDRFDNYYVVWQLNNETGAENVTYCKQSYSWFLSFPTFSCLFIHCCISIIHGTNNAIAHQLSPFFRTKHPLVFPCTAEWKYITFNALFTFGKTPLYLKQFTELI